MHALRRMKTGRICQRMSPLRAGQLLPWHSKLGSIVRGHSIEVDDANEIAEKIDIRSLMRPPSNRT
jgi:hypothetical protein